MFRHLLVRQAQSAARTFVMLSTLAVARGKNGQAHLPEVFRDRTIAIKFAFSIHRQSFLNP